MPGNGTAGSQSEGIGANINRREDHRMLTGQSTYIDDINAPNMVYRAICRSIHGHAKIKDIDTKAADATDGVIATYTWDDIDETDIAGDIPCIYHLDEQREPTHRILAKDKARYQGKPVAVVVAENRYTAHQACDLIEVDYERLEAVTDPREAIDDDAPNIHATIPDNVCFRWETGDAKGTSVQFGEADHTFEWEFLYPRIVPNALDPRGAVASFDSVTEELKVHLPSQNPFTHQEILATVLDLPKRKIRVITPDVGGAFGSKSMAYPGEMLAAFCSMQLDQPVKWISTRTEAFQADEQGRGQWITARAAFDNDGTIRALRIETLAGIGGELSTKGMIGPATTFGPLTSGQYAIPAIHFSSKGIFTNTTPTGTYRGVGRAEAAYTIERVMTLAARELEIDPAEIRRINCISSDYFPYETAVGTEYDSGQYVKALNVALDTIDYEGFRKQQDEAISDGRYLGIGIASFVEATGYAPAKSAEKLGMTKPDSKVKMSNWEVAKIQIHETGEVVAYCGTASHGQGSETTHSQIIADKLGVSVSDVGIREGKDTRRGPPGTGTFGSRGTVMGGSALVNAAEKIIDKAHRIAAHQLEAKEDDVEFVDGEFVVMGASHRSMTLGEVATAAYLANDLPEDVEPGLEATASFNPSNLTYSFGTHIATVEVNPDTGEVDILRYVAVDDCGVKINPEIVEGQIQGGIVAGIGATLYEKAVYDDNATLMNGSFMDYPLLKAHQVPELETRSTVTPSTENPLGVKGVGESGAIPPPPAITNAVTDALDQLGIAHIDLPLTNETVWQTFETTDRH